MSSTANNALRLDLNSSEFMTPQKKQSHPYSPSPFDNFAYGGPTELENLAPHPDDFDSELESLDFKTFLPFDITSFPTIDQAVHSLPNFYGDFRSGPASTITVSSESQSGYDFDTMSYYSSHESSSGYIPSDSVTSSYAPYVQRGSLSTYGAASSDVDLDFNDFNLTVPSSMTSPTALHSVLPPINTAALDSVHAIMEPHPPVPRQHSIYEQRSADSVIDHSYGQPLTPPSNDVVPMKREASRSPPTVTEPAPQKRSRVSPDASGPAKKYPCTSCSRSFTRAFNLKTHMATHDPNRIKAFVCRQLGCGRSFSRKHDLGRHLMSIHGTDTQSSVSGHSQSSTGAGHRSATESISSSATSKGGAKQRIWCDGCGRGWIKGTREACECDEYDPRGD